MNPTGTDRSILFFLSTAVKLRFGLTTINGNVFYQLTMNPSPLRVLHLSLWRVLNSCRFKSKEPRSKNQINPNYKTRLPAGRCEIRKKSYCFHFSDFKIGISD